MKSSMPLNNSTACRRSFRLVAFLIYAIMLIEPYPSTRTPRKVRRIYTEIIHHKQGEYYNDCVREHILASRRHYQ